MTIDPGGTGIKGQIFGLPFTEKDSDLVLVPVPWEATTSYGGGAALGPEAILEASSQVDLLDYDFGTFYERGLAYLKTQELSQISAVNDKAKRIAQEVIGGLEEGQTEEDFSEQIQLVNTHSETVHNWVYEKCKALRAQGKAVAVVGGDHSSPLGLIKCLSEEFKGNFGILHVDAHADLRKAYQGFTYSHASIMYNVLQLKNPPQELIQVGVRDYSQEEVDVMKEYETICNFDRALRKRLFKGETWSDICREIVRQLPEKVYVSFDIDGLSPDLCPGTGTPVPGGLSFDEAVELLAEVRSQGKTVVGMDLCEVAPQASDSDWDANVGARVLYKLCGLLLSGPV